MFFGVFTYFLHTAEGEQGLFFFFFLKVLIAPLWNKPRCHAAKRPTSWLRSQGTSAEHGQLDFFFWNHEGANLTDGEMLGCRQKRLARADAILALPPKKANRRILS